MAHKLRRNGYLSVECLETSPVLGPASSLVLVLYMVEMDETRGVTRLSQRTRLDPIISIVIAYESLSSIQNIST